MRSIKSILFALCFLSAVVPARADVSGGYFAVIVKDLETSTHWYSAVFGLETGDLLSDGETYWIVNLTKPSLFVELLELKNAEQRSDGLIEGPFKVGLLVEDLSGFVANLPDAVTRPETIVDDRNGLLIVQLRDPDNNIVQVMQIVRPPLGD